MFKLLTNLTKAVVGVALVSVAVVVDVVQLPARALDNEPAFKSTGKLLDNVDECIECIEEAIRPEDSP